MTVYALFLDGRLVGVLNGCALGDGPNNDRFEMLEGRG